jgi:signal transduction histidine kinase
LPYDLFDAVHPIEADSKRLRRVFTNVLDNASNFSKEKGKIILVTQETDGEVIVTIEDQGNGIDPGDLPNIFDAFHRGRGTEKKKVQSSD